MGVFVRGEIVIVPFPFTNNSTSKLRPAFVVKRCSITNDYILLPVTSQGHHAHLIEITQINFENGTLKEIPSYIQYSKIFTFEAALISKKIAKLNKAIVDKIMDSLLTFLST